MAKGPKHEPEVTDLGRYRKAKAAAAKRKQPPPPPPPRKGAGYRPDRGAGGGQGFLGSNPRAGLILAVVVVVLAALWLGPMLLRFL